MSIDEIIEFIESLGGVLVLRPGPGDGTPEIAWGDAFFYYAPDGQVPTATQPFATIVTKDYPDDRASRLDRPGAFRVNISAGKDAFTAWTGYPPRESAGRAGDSSITDTVLAHPVYGGAGWLAVVDPGPRTREPLRELLRAAHDRARTRYQRRAR
ncbi:DUF6194 family protein [Nocardia wallacei]|uniref:DUF6194 domain-containing protein n=1 Tax=Nocardia wallacei TaxID=480035 RepID=A0A7G1KQY3_9NOCA|nr:DUF6194 family protein [Nocardia wallacei]BCK57637.1 hypothetical protein NWFMUON74_54090 [Nocardia wallacei]